MLKKDLFDYFADRGLLNGVENILSISSAIISLLTVFQFIWSGNVTAAIIILLLVALLLVSNIQAFRYKMRSVCIEDLYYGNTPLISTITYLINTRRRNFPQHNRVKIRTVHIGYLFEEDENEHFEDHSLALARQALVYTFKGSNDTKEPVYSFGINFIHSMFANQKDSHLEVSCKRDDGTYLDTLIKFKESGPLRRLVEIEFTGTGLAPNEGFQLEIRKESRPASFREPEHFLIDPAQYGDGDILFSLELDSNSDYINRQQVSLLEVDRKTFKIKKKKILNKTKFCQFNEKIAQQYQGTGIYSNRNSVYLLRIES